MAIATRTLKDTAIATGSGAAGGKVTVLVNMNDNTTADSLVVDASGLTGHANGAKLDITRIWWGLVQGTADDNTGHGFRFILKAILMLQQLILLAQDTMMVLLVRLRKAQQILVQLQET